MTDREKHLSLALDALVQFEERLLHMHRNGRIDMATHLDLYACISDVRHNIEAAAMPRPSLIRRLITRRAA